MNINRYSVKTTKIDNGKGYWSHLLCEIFENENKIGEYKRNYSSLYNTFVPFKQGDKEYALYSPNYTATRVMKLPSCEDIAGEEPKSFGFCPTGFYVPSTETYTDEDPQYSVVGPDGQFGFVCGCVWGDDSSWKIQYLDLTQIEQGILKRDDRFGYIELLGSSFDLRSAIEVDDFTQDEWNSGEVIIKIACTKRFYIRGEQ